jgi:hypothetical protein
MTESKIRARSPAGVAILSDAPLDDSNRDYFGFRVYAEAIASLIDNDLTDTPLTIAVSAPWGGGKTSVARMVRHRLAERAASRGQDRPVLACWFDAWMHSDAPHLGAALATAVARTTNGARPMWRRLLNPLPVAMLGPQERTRRRVLMGCVAVLVAALVVVITPLNGPVSRLLDLNLPENADTTGPLLTSLLLALAVARSVFRAAEDAAQFVDDPRSEAARGSMAQVRQQLGDLIHQARRGGLLVIYVDDLERCAPERALEVCEVTSQLLSHEGVVTVLVADMQTVAAAADMRYPESGLGSDGVGRRYLEKIVQLQVALPPPHREHIRRLLRGDAPDRVFTRLSARSDTQRSLRSPSQSIFVSVADAVTGAFDRVGWYLGGLALVGAVLVTVLSVNGAVIGMLLVLPFVVLGVARLFVAWRARRARNAEEAIRDMIRLAVDDQTPPDELESRVLSRTDPRYETLALDLLESFRLDNTPELQRVVDVILKYPPDLPRSAKRMLNHARLLTQIAREREIFGGDPDLTPEHLGEWIVLAERWPQIARRVSTNAVLLAALESADDRAAVETILHRHDLPVPAVLEDLIDLLDCDPRLSDVVARLVHFEPAAIGGSADAQVLGVDRGV